MQNTDKNLVKELPGEASNIEMGINPVPELEVPNLDTKIATNTQTVTLCAVEDLLNASNLDGGSPAATVEAKVELKPETIKQEAGVANENVDLDKQLEDQRLRDKLSNLNNLALLEIEDLEVQKAMKDREEKGRDFRKRLWGGIWSPWQSLKGAAKSVWNFVGGFGAKARSYQDTKNLPQRERERHFASYNNEKIQLESKANTEHQFIVENGREPADYLELLNFKGKKADELLKNYTEKCNYWNVYEKSDEHKKNLQKIIDSKGTLEAVNEWSKKPIINDLRAINNWSKKPLFKSSSATKLKAAYALYGSSEVENLAAPTAAYSEENTYAGVVRGNNGGKPNYKVKKPKKSGLSWKLIGAFAVVLTALGIYKSKTNQAEQNASYSLDNTVMVDDKANAQKVEVKAAEVKQEDSLENIASDKTVDNGQIKKVEKIAVKTLQRSIYSGSKSKSVVMSSSKIEKPAEAVRLKTAQELMQEVELEKLNQEFQLQVARLKASMQGRLNNLKAKIANPGYVNPVLPAGMKAYGPKDITSTNVAGIPQSESNESKIVVVEGILAKEAPTKDELDNAEKALAEAENRVVNNILAENEGRYRNAYDLHVVTARAKLKGFRQRAVQQMLKGETDSENMLKVKVSGEKKYYFVDLNKVEQKINALKSDFSTEAQAKHSCDYANWFVEHAMLSDVK